MAEIVPVSTIRSEAIKASLVFENTEGSESGIH